MLYIIFTISQKAFVRFIPPQKQFAHFSYSVCFVSFSFALCVCVFFSFLPSLCIYFMQMYFIYLQNSLAQICVVRDLTPIRAPQSSYVTHNFIWICTRQSHDFGSGSALERMVNTIRKGQPNTPNCVCLCNLENKFNRTSIHISWWCI